MRNYLKLKCTICERKKDVRVDTKSATFPKCSITLGCAGTLRPFQYTDSPDTIADSAPVGVQNWYSRFRQIVNFSNVLDPDFPITYSDSAEMFIAIKHNDFPAMDDSFKLQVTLTSPSVQNRQFREYLFNTVSQVEKLFGVESGSGKKVLRFVSNGVNPEEISVFKNGVKLEEGTSAENYQVARDGNTIQQNAIVLNAPVRGTNQFKIVISRPTPARTEIVEFDKLTEFDTVQSCWNNSDYITFKNEKYHIFFKRFSGVSLSAGQIISISQVNLSHNGLSTVPLNNCFVLLSGGPTKIDRILTGAVDLGTISTMDYPLLVVKTDQVVAVTVKERIISEKFPQFVVRAFKHEGILKVTTSNDVTDSLSQTTIINPSK